MGASECGLELGKLWIQLIVYYLKREMLQGNWKLESTWYGTVACVYAFIMYVFSFIAIYQLQARGSLHYDTYNLLEFPEDDYLIDLFNACSSLLVKLEKC